MNSQFRKGLTGGIALIIYVSVLGKRLGKLRPQDERELHRGSVGAAYQRLLDQGWTDALRHLHPHDKIYTFWKYWRGAFERNAGLRIDHFLLNPAAASLLVAAEVDIRPRGWEKTSDHAPLWIELADTPRQRRSPTSKKT